MKAYKQSTKHVHLTMTNESEIRFHQNDSLARAKGKRAAFTMFQDQDELPLRK